MANTYGKRRARLNRGYDPGLDSDIEEYIESDWDGDKGAFPVALFKLNYMTDKYKRKRFAGTQLDLFKRT